MNPQGPASSAPPTRDGIQIRPWADRDLDLLRESNSPGMTAHIGGPETDDAVVARHARYLRMWHTGEAHMFAIVDGAVLTPTENRATNHYGR